MHRWADEPLAAGPLRRGTCWLVLAAAQAGEDRDECSHLLRGRVAEDLDPLSTRHRRGVGLLELVGGHSGMFPCFFGGSVSRFVFSARSALLMFIRELLGVMTVSMYPRSAAT